MNVHCDILGSKASTLSQLKGRLTRGVLLDQLVFDHSEWERGRQAVTARVLAWFGEDAPLAVRSSATGEDGVETSMAGSFHTALNVVGRDAFSRAVDDVMASYGEPDASDEILIQPMVREAVLTGVATSREPGSGRAYRIVNYVEHDDTAAVSAGVDTDVRTYYLHRSEPVCGDDQLSRVLRLLGELERLTGQDDLDIEFACPQIGLPVLLQCRRLINLQGEKTREADRLHRTALDLAADRLRMVTAPQPFVAGRRSALGMMPDWNPAEIIGTRPRPLAYSLYRALITDFTWAEQRARYGYRDLRGQRLMVDVLGIPFIDVRASFNSFVPASLPEPFAERLVDHYVDRLRATPAQHDKVEFAIVHSCLAFDGNDEMARLEAAGFDRRETRMLAEALLGITRAALDPAGKLRGDARAGLAMLQERYRRLDQRPTGPLPIRIRILLEDCRRFGTLPFAAAARTAFIAFKLLRSAQTVGILSRADVDAFLRTVRTVSGDMRAALAGEKAAFLERYGHLRPGTYDIRAVRYDVAYDSYFSSSPEREPPRSAPARDFALSPGQKAEIGGFLDAHGLPFDADGLFDVIRTALEERESAKLLFSRHTSIMLTCIDELGAQHGLTADDMSYADISAIVESPYAMSSVDRALRSSIDGGREKHGLTEKTILPPLLFDGDSLTAFHMPGSEPNFVTSGRCIGEVRPARQDVCLAGAIVMIPNADPGFDWLFTRGIGGLITAYGGINSHMAIRAGEAGLPAVIGAGHVLFEKWARAKVLHIDCANRVVQVMR